MLLCRYVCGKAEKYSGDQLFMMFLKPQCAFFPPGRRRISFGFPGLLSRFFLGPSFPLMSSLTFRVVICKVIAEGFYDSGNEGNYIRVEGNRTEYKRFPSLLPVWMCMILKTHLFREKKSLNQQFIHSLTHSIKNEYLLITCGKPSRSSLRMELGLILWEGWGHTATLQPGNCFN